MAFLPNTQDQNQQQNQQQGQVPTVPQIPTLQGTSGPTASQSSGASGVTNTASPAAAPSTPWQNISAYLGANAGQAGQVADTIAGNLGSQYNAANQGIQQAQQNFGQQVQSARVPYDQQAAQQAAQSPSQFASDPNNVAAFQKMFNANYAGPQSFSGTQNYSDLQSQVQNAQQQAGLVNQGTPGLMTLLQGAESQGGRNPTQGITALDSLLMQEDPNNFGKLSAAAQPFAGLSSYLSSTQQGLDTAAQNAAKEAAATQSQIQGQFTGPGGVVPTFQGKINQQLQDLSKQGSAYNGEISDIQSRLAGGQQLTAQELYDVDRTGGLSAMDSTFQNALQFPGMSPGMLAQFYQQPAAGMVQQPTMANAMSPQQFADAQALNQLLGQNAIPLPAGVAPYSTPTDFGSFNDQAAFQSILNNLNADTNVALSQQTNPQTWADYNRDVNWFTGALGLPNSPTQPVISPIAPPAPPTPTLGGGIPGTDPTPPPITNGGGRAFR